MGGFLSSIMERWGKFYRRSSIQVILSLSFTAVAVAGMIFLGLTLFLRFSASNNAQLAKNSQRVLAQVNLNLDAYLRGMMRVSDTMYYRVIKNADLDSDSLDAQMALLYESNRDSLVSIALFSEEGDLLAAAPMGVLKNSVSPERESWFTAATRFKWVPLTGMCCTFAKYRSRSLPAVAKMPLLSTKAFPDLTP